MTVGESFLPGSMSVFSKGIIEKLEYLLDDAA
jgi:hypothetical protein